MSRDPRKRKPITVKMDFEFHAMDDYVLAVCWIGGDSIGLRFESMDQLMKFTSNLIENAVKVWPNHPLSKEYLEDG